MGYSDVGVDPETHEVWTAINDALVHLDSSGNRLDVYYLEISDTASLKPSAILVEPDRILIASGSWGVYEFPRPDKPSQSQLPQNNLASGSTIIPQQIPPQPQSLGAH